MAFMEKLRQNVFGVFGTIILFIILILFLWGDASRGTNQMDRSATVAGVINGEEISYAEFNKRVETITAQRRQANPDAEINEQQIREQVWDQIVNEKLIEQGAKELGLAMSDEQLKDVLLNDPPQQLKSWFTDSTGRFIADDYYQFMTNMEGFFASRQVPADQAAQIRSQILELQEAVRFQYSYQGLMGIVGSLYPPSPAILQSKFELQNAKASGSFIMLNPNMISDAEVPVTEEEAKEYYEKHKEEYNRKASRTIRYSMLRMGPSAQDSQKVQARFRRYTEELAKGTTGAQKDSIFGLLASELGTQLYAGTTYTPAHEIQPELAAQLNDSSSIVGPVRIGGKIYYVNVVDRRDSGAAWVKAQHILIAPPEGTDSVAKAAMDDSLKQAAEAIAVRARGGEDFTKLVQENSKDPSASQNDGDVGWFSKESNFVQEFKDAAIPASKGQIIGPVKTQFGYHIIKVTDKSTRQYKLRAINFDVSISSATRNQLRRQADELRRRLEKGENFDSAAAAMNLQVMDQVIEGPNRPIATSYALSNFAYEGDIGSVSNVVKMPDDALIVAQVSKVTPAGPAPFEEVKDLVMAKMRMQKKIEKLKGKAEQIRAGLSASDSLSKALAIDSTLIIRDFVDQAKGNPFPDAGYDARLAAAVFNLKSGELSAPIRGETGYYIVKVNTIQVPGEAEFKQGKGEFYKTHLVQQRQTLLSQWLQEQRDKAKIERNWDR